MWLQRVLSYAHWRVESLLIVRMPAKQRANVHSHSCRYAPITLVAAE